MDGRMKYNMKRGSSKLVPQGLSEFQQLQVIWHQGMCMCDIKKTQLVTIPEPSNLLSYRSLT